VAARYLDALARDYYGDAGKEPAPRGAASPEERLAEAERKLSQAREQLEAARKEHDARLEAARRKGEEQKEKLQEWLKDARARESAAREEAARAREAADVARREQERLAAALAAARAVDSAQELHRARADARDLEGRVTSLEGRLERARERERELDAELDRARASAAASAGPTPSGAGPDDEPEEAPATWLFPVYTREFYDSLDGWDRRIQRAAFKQAALLAQDHRHPSLRALPLEGLPGYYRVRVATDVRLLYRRPERQNTIEILSLIDREDLDRYIKQAKTR
jgi:DNA repair exonuclease SbcCD ATPase subunit